jgi:acetyl-CoA acetyltransferase
MGWNGYSALRPKPDARPTKRTMNLGPMGETVRNLYAPYGLMSAAQHYSLYLRYYVERYDVPEDAAATVAITCREHAQLNRKALMRGRPLSRAEYDASPYVAEPLRKHDCCLETDCATAIVVTSRERARDLPRPPVIYLGGAEGHPQPADEIANRPDPPHVPSPEPASRRPTSTSSRSTTASPTSSCSNSKRSAMRSPGEQRHSSRTATSASQADTR